ncbi:MAG: hypothetical protein SAL07_09425 [Oscillatoria sp. PMC 1051.18]|nr:hypothetical protein [Oscillatoria sp. PMC 1050.18]MEC5030122.1 hypothetical protein [Oscillatoria sp. PMC 1051.18]
MQKYLDNGSSLCYLIYPIQKRVEIYRSEGNVEVLESPNTVSGEDVLPEFVLNLNKFW